MAVRVLDTRTGRVVGELRDEAEAIAPAGWSPVPGDQRLVLIREVAGSERPWMWDLATGDLAEIAVDAPGALFLQDWFPAADALLIRQDHEARDTLLRLDLASRDGHRGRAHERHHLRGRGPPRRADLVPRGERGRAAALPLGGRRGGRAQIPGAAQAPAGRPFEAVWFANPSGDRIQGWLIRPDGEGPFPTIVSVHGGPEYHNTDAFDVRRLAYADHGFAVLLVNYRGSTGYGTAFRHALQGNIGFPESEDLNAGLDHLVSLGVADPQRLFIEGWSWGGYLATLNAGLHPDRWRAVLAGIPVGDYVASHYEAALPLRDWDDAIMGGGPMDLPALYAERNPMTYVDRVTAPMLMIAGEHDSRCPLGQVMVYAHALRVRGKDVAVHLYPGGHHANDVEGADPPRRAGDGSVPTPALGARPEGGDQPRPPWSMQPSGAQRAVREARQQLVGLRAVVLVMPVVMPLHAVLVMLGSRRGRRGPAAGRRRRAPAAGVEDLRRVEERVGAHRLEPGDRRRRRVHAVVHVRVLAGVAGLVVVRQRRHLRPGLGHGGGILRTMAASARQRLRRNRARSRRACVRGRWRTGAPA